jgi:hypothetical protein
MLMVRLGFFLLSVLSEGRREAEFFISIEGARSERCKIETAICIIIIIMIFISLLISSTLASLFECSGGLLALPLGVSDNFSDPVQHISTKWFFADFVVVSNNGNRRSAHDVHDRFESHRDSAISILDQSSTTNLLSEILRS